jgi:hypothetical protein
VKYPKIRMNTKSIHIQWIFNHITVKELSCYQPANNKLRTSCYPNPKQSHGFFNTRFESKTHNVNWLMVLKKAPTLWLWSLNWIHFILTQNKPIYFINTVNYLVSVCLNFNFLVCAKPWETTVFINNVSIYKSMSHFAWKVSPSKGDHPHLYKTFSFPTVHGEFKSTKV